VNSIVRDAGAGVAVGVVEGTAVAVPVEVGAGPSVASVEVVC
jgi:hypothetical protein